MWGVITERFHQWLAYIRQMLFDCSSLIMIEHKSFGADSGSFYLLSCVTGDKEKNFASNPGVERKPQTSALNVLHLLCALAAREKSGDQLLTVLQRRNRHRIRRIGH